MRVAIVAESFLPRINGVTNSVCRILEHLQAAGHEALLVAPGPGPATYAGAPILRTPAVALPFVPGFHVGVPNRRLDHVLRAWAPDVVHLASPFVLGAAGAAAACRVGIPYLAVFQTDIAGFARRYGLGSAEPAIWAWLRRLHDPAALTLVPSAATGEQLVGQGFTNLARWGRGVDTDRFAPRHRDPARRAALAPSGEVLVGYVGRLAPEKQVHLLEHVSDVPGTRLVIVGDGPSRRLLERRLPHAAFLGLRTGAQLSAAVASLDVFVHPGADETFCQSVQEAQAAAVAVVAAAAGGPLDLVDHGRTGLLHPPGDPAAMRAAVARLAADPGLRAACGEAARRAVLGRTWESVCGELVGHYTQAVRLGRVPDGRAAATATAAAAATAATAT